MTAHTFRIMWNKRKTNLLILIELIITFFVLFSVLAVSTYHYNLYKKPLGFNVENGWTVATFVNKVQEQKFPGTGKQLMEAIAQLPEVASVHVVKIGPFGYGRGRTDLNFDDSKTSVDVFYSSDGTAQSLGVTLLEGRWFGPEDEGQNWQPILINKYFRDLTFPDASPIGLQTVSENGGRKPSRIVGVFEDFRFYGAFMPPQPFIFSRLAADEKVPSIFLAVVARDGSGARLEKSIHDTLQRFPQIQVGFVVKWSDLQRSYLATKMAPLIIMILVAIFLIIMVSFGLFGVLWQNVTRRTREIGVRRAMGATRNSVQIQIVMETVVLSLLAVAAGFLILVQLPISGYIKQLDWALFWGAMIPSVFSICILSALCALYPGWLAARLDPVDALHYE